MSRNVIILPVGDSVIRLTVAEKRDGERWPVSLLTIVREGEAAFAAFGKDEDARLMVAAPDILAALENMLHTFVFRCACDRENNTVAAARAAIAKATGQ